jgi:hypothetical protein
MMSPLLDAFWRAVAYCLHPRVILLSLLPLLIAGGGVWILGVFFWEQAIDGINAWLHTWSLVDGARQWLVSVGWANVFSMLPIVVLLALAVPAIVLVTLLLVALFMVPSIVKLVTARRFPTLQRREGGGFLASASWSLWCTALAAIALIASIPLWFIPPLVLIVPPLIWGWLSYKVMTFDVLSEHADRDERRRILREHRWPLLGIGIITGYLGSAPTLIWGIGAMALPLAPVLMPVSLWLYTLVFAFSALWFAHYALAALQALRVQAGATLRPVDEVIDLPPASPAPPAAPAAPLPPPQR